MHNRRCTALSWICVSNESLLLRGSVVWKQTLISQSTGYINEPEPLWNLLDTMGNILKQNAALTQTHIWTWRALRWLFVWTLCKCVWTCVFPLTGCSAGVNSAETKAEARGDPESRATLYLYSAFICWMEINKTGITPKSHMLHTHTRRLFRVNQACLAEHTPKVNQNKQPRLDRQSILTGGSELKRTAETETGRKRWANHLTDDQHTHTHTHTHTSWQLPRWQGHWISAKFMRGHAYHYVCVCARSGSGSL